MDSIIFNEFAVLIALSVVFGAVAMWLKQPLILSFIIVGVVAGPSVLGWITVHSEIEVLASFGVTLLLFIVGLKLDFELIKAYGVVALLTGLGQIVLTTILGFLLCLSLGMSSDSAFYIAFALTISSTIIIIKVLSDRSEIDSLYGRMTVGILIVQDLVVVVAIIIFSALQVHYETYTQLQWELAGLLFKGIIFLGGIFGLMRYTLPALVNYLAKSRELLVLFAIAWAVVIAVLSDQLGFGKEVGGFLAGISLASTTYRESIASRLDPLRNVLILFFFLNLGATLQFGSLASNILPALILSGFVLLAKPLIVMVMMGLLGFRKRTGFLAGATMGQISEFSLILATLGLSLGYLDADEQSLVTLIAIITIAFSTYFMTYVNTIYGWVSDWLHIFERKTSGWQDAYKGNKHVSVDIILYGFGRHGRHLAKLLEERDFKVLAVDFDPEKIKSRRYHHALLRFGDAEDADFPKHLPLDSAKWVVSTLPMLEGNATLVKSLREHNYQGKIALSVHHENEMAATKDLKPDLILVPYQDAAEMAAEKILEFV